MFYDNEDDDDDDGGGGNDDDDDNDDGMWSIFLLTKTHYWRKIENVRCTRST